MSSNVENCLDSLIKKTKLSTIGPSQQALYIKTIYFIAENADYITLNNEQIDFLINTFIPSFGPVYYNDNNFYNIFNKILLCTEKSNNLDLLIRMYLSLPLIKNLSKEIEIIKNGIEKLLSQKSYNSAGKLYLHLAWGNTGIQNVDQRIDKEIQILYCKKALELLDKSTLDYTRAISVYKYLKYTIPIKENNIIHYNVFFTKALFYNKKILFNYDLCWCNFSSLIEPQYFDLPIMKGYNKLSSSPCEYSKGIILSDETLNVGEKNLEYDLAYISNNITVNTNIGEFKGCHVFKYIRHNMIIENYFKPDIGIVRVVSTDQEGNKYNYELCSYKIIGGKGLIPLHIGNKWSYKQHNCTSDIDQIIEREVVSFNNNEYNISGLDIVYKIT